MENLPQLNDSFRKKDEDPRSKPKNRRDNSIDDNFFPSIDKKDRPRTKDK